MPNLTDTTRTRNDPVETGFHAFAVALLVGVAGLSVAIVLAVLG
jgi:F0F1-type ATP synthase membrane subunit c/vacuolar-type H+-ATPase subunit K